MKTRKSLIPVSIVLPGLLVATAYAYNNGSDHENPSPPWHGSQTHDAETGYTDAHYQSATSKWIRRRIDGINAWTSQLEVMTDDEVLGTYVAATYSWNVGCYSDGLCEVWDDEDPNHIISGSFDTVRNGAWAYVF
jgi:hypothetical protein